MDLVKSIVSFAVIAALTYLVLDRYSEGQAKRRSQEDAGFQLRIDALCEFRRATLAYQVAARSAFADLYQWRGKVRPRRCFITSRRRMSDGSAAIEEVRRVSDDRELRETMSHLQEAHPTSVITFTTISLICAWITKILHLSIRPPDGLILTS